eukprot:4175750-Alexandrium_andersonii.AAC.1
MNLGPAVALESAEGKAARRRRAATAHRSTANHPHACVSARSPAAWPAASLNHWKAADCQAPRV